MTSDDLLKAIFPFVGGAVGAVTGAYFKAWFDARQEERRTRLLQRQKRWLPLLGTVIRFKTRLVELTGVYRRTTPGMPFSPESLSADFRELYALDRAEKDLENIDPNRLRADAESIQQVRIRMTHYLTYAASSLYLMAAYVACAESMLRALKDHSLSVPELERKRLTQLLCAVQQAMQGPTGAGIPWEEQQSVAEMMWGENDTMISYFEFRKRLLEAPGWEQYTGLHRFFVSLGPKMEHEVAATIESLSQLQTELENATSSP